MPRPRLLAALSCLAAVLPGCGAVGGFVGDVASGAIGDRVAGAIAGAIPTPGRAGGGGDIAMADFAPGSALPSQVVPRTAIDTAGVVAWARDELGVELRRDRAYPNGAGGLLVRFAQTHDGLPVVGAAYVAEVLEGETDVATLAGRVFDDVDRLRTRPRVDAAGAARAARGPAAPDSASLLILSRTHPFVAEHTLAWRVRTAHDGEPVDAFVDAQTGALLGRISLIQTAGIPERRPRAIPLRWRPPADTSRATLRLPTVHNGRREAAGQEIDGLFRLIHPDWDYRVGALLDSGDRVGILTSRSATRWPDRGWRNGAYDTYWGVERAHEHFAATYGWEGLDGARSRYQVLFGNLDGSADPFPNAFFSADRNLVGFGWTEADGPWATPEIVGHELGHALDHHSAGLVYFGESGALDETIADVRGMGVLRGTGGGPDLSWHIGVEIGPPLRSMQAPKSGRRPQPDTRKGVHWLDPVACAALDPDSQTDKCGVHINSGVGNKWFYLLSEGGFDTNDLGDGYNVQGIGFDLAERIVDRAHRRYLTSTSGYDDYRRASVAAAADLSGENPMSCEAETVRAVEEAWYAVGVGPEPCECFEGTMTMTLSGDESMTLPVYVRGDEIAVRVPTDQGDVVQRTRMGSSFISMRGAATFDGTPPFTSSVRLLPQPPIEDDVLIAAWDSSRTGRTRPNGDYTEVEYDVRELARRLAAQGIPVDNPTGGRTLWTVRGVCLSFLDVSVGMTQIRYGASERKQARKTFGFALPTEMRTSDGSYRITEIRDGGIPPGIFD